jgi:urease accessory protein
MIARASAVICPRGVVRSLSSQPPITLRQVQDDLPSCATLCLVGSAAGPLSGDDLSLSISVQDAALGRLTATGAMIAQGRGTTAALLRSRVNVGSGAALHADPGPLIVCAGSAINVLLEIDLDESATLSWRELVVLGRSDEHAGAARLQWNVRRAGRPLLRQSVDLTDAARRSWPGILHGKRVILTELSVHPGRGARTVVQSPTAVTQRLSDDASLTTVLANDAAEAVRTLTVLASQRHIAVPDAKTERAG